MKFFSKDPEGIDDSVSNGFIIASLMLLNAWKFRENESSESSKIQAVGLKIPNKITEVANSLYRIDELRSSFRDHVLSLPTESNFWEMSSQSFSLSSTGSCCLTSFERERKKINNYVVTAHSGYLQGKYFKWSYRN